MVPQNVIVDSNVSNTYEELEKKFQRAFSERNYLFEISKCCGYSELVNCTKGDTLKKLYENVSAVFEIKNINLYVLVEGRRLWIPNTDIEVNKYIKELWPFLKPEYPLPAKIVYKIYMDDGSCHIGQHQTPTLPYANVCVSCRIHN
jgi:hypothetical protein